MLFAEYNLQLEWTFETPWIYRHLFGMLLFTAWYVHEYIYTTFFHFHWGKQPTIWRNHSFLQNDVWETCAGIFYWWCGMGSASDFASSSQKHHQGYLDPEIRGGGGGSKKNFFSALQAPVWSKNKWGSGPPGSSSGSTTDYPDLGSDMSLVLNFCTHSSDILQGNQW